MALSSMKMILYIYINIYIYYIYNIPHENDDFGDGFSGRKMALVV